MEQGAADANGAGMLLARHDIAGRMIRISGVGSWSMALLERHLVELQRLIARARTTGNGLRVLSDLSRAAVQGPDVAARIEGFTAEAYGPDDRIAVVVASSLLKMQMRRVVRRARFETFLSAAAAEMWLRAHDDGQATPAILARAPRRATSMVVTVASEAGQTLAVRIVNISASGFLFDGRGSLGVGDGVTITLPGLDAATGRIVRVRDSLAGVRFDRPVAVERLMTA